MRFLTGGFRAQLRLCTFATLTGGFLLLAGSAHAAYVFQDIIDTADPTFNQALGINNAGTIAGYFGSGTPNAAPPPFTQHPNKGYTVAPSYTSFTNENFTSSFQTQVTGINNPGQTVGFWADSNGATTPNFFGFVFKNGTFTSVIDPNTPATGPTTNQLLGINDAGIAAGFYNDADGNGHAYLYNTNLPSFGSVILPLSFNVVSSAATGVNNGGVISGFFVDTAGDTHGFLDRGGIFTSFQAFGDATQFLGVNNQGQAVGFYTDGAGTNHGFVYTISNGTFVIIDDPLAAAGEGNGTTVNGTNDKGQLVGFYVNADGNTIGMLATPAVPEPGPLALVACGLAALGLRRRIARTTV